MDNSDMEIPQLDLARANETIKNQAREIAELKYRLEEADKFCASHFAAFIGGEFEREVSRLRKAKEAALSSSNGDNGRASLIVELNAWEEALKTLLEMTGNGSTTVTAIARSLKERPIDNREKASLERIIAALAVMAKLDLSQASKASVVLVQAAAGRVVMPKSPTTLDKHLESAFKRAEMERRNFEMDHQ